MSDIFEMTERPPRGVFFSRKDPNDPRMGELVRCDPEHYSAADLVIIGCPQDEGVRRNGGRVGAAEAPQAVREQFYRLTTFNMKRRVFDLGDVVMAGTLEETHDVLTAVVEQVLKDNKRAIVLGGGNDISYADGRAMAEIFGIGAWIAVNVDSHLDVRLAEQRNSGTPYRQLLDEGHLRPDYFYEVGYQSHLCSPVYYEYIRDLGVNRISLELLRSRAEADLELKESIRNNFIGHSSSMNTFFGFDMDAVRSADAPGTSAPSPLGLRAGEFIQLVKYAASLANTRLIEFTETNPKYDIDDRTAKLVAIGMHRFCTGVA
ncbi:MAG: formimidoylglutamase [Acidobacteria bacterium]|nr:formimidoylglutamase [Acidobacteriota bacterium]